jgi:hypothetical protein
MILPENRYPLFGIMRNIPRGVREFNVLRPRKIAVGMRGMRKSNVRVALMPVSLVGYPRSLSREEEAWRGSKKCGRKRLSRSISSAWAWSSWAISLSRSALERSKQLRAMRRQFSACRRRNSVFNMAFHVSEAVAV